MQTTINAFKSLTFSQTELKLFGLVAESAQALNDNCYLIGGYVRDKILNKQVKDIDFVCLGSGIELAQFVANKLPGNPAVTEFKNFGTAHIRYQDIDLEFVGARKESYQRESRNPSVEKGSLEDDQNRRDFTINALAISLNKVNYGFILDPFNGLQGILNKTIKTPLEPHITFSDDPLRMMRAIRFAAQLQFTIDPVTFAAIQQEKERISIISQERITDELSKIILTKQPSIGFKLLFDSGLLAIIFPELFHLYGVDMQDGKGHKDNFYHTLEVLDNISVNTSDLWLRWAAILHDIAKPATKKFNPKLGWSFHGHEAVGARMVKKIFARLKLPLDHKMKFVEKLVLLHLRPISLTKENVTDSAIRRLLFEAGDDITSLMMLCEADITTKNRSKVKRFMENFLMVRQKLIEVEQHDRISNFQPPVTGEVIMVTFALTPGKEVGTLKNVIREAILEGAIPNEFEPAFELMLIEGAKMGLTRKVFTNVHFPPKENN